MKKYSDEYLSYLKSDKWREQRARAFDHDGHMCAICGATDNLEGHHIRYTLLGTDDDWLEVLTVCHDCHEKLEDIKAEARQTKKETEQESRTPIIDDRADLNLTIIAALIKRPECYPYISHVFSLEDFSEDDTVGRAAAYYVIWCLDWGKEPLLADLISHFDKVEDQQRISRIADYEVPEDHFDLSKFMTQALRALKQRKMEELMQKADAESVMRAVRMQKELGRLEIHID